jgi:hypothetical protein
MDTCPERAEEPLEASSRILFLDDDPGRAAEFLMLHPDSVWVKTAEDCIAQLAEPWHIVHLDHDLGGEIFVDSDRDDCGMEVVRWLCGGGPIPHLRETHFVVHTHNMNAAGVMVSKLRAAGYETVYRPFGIDFRRWLEAEGCGALEPEEDLPRRPTWLGWFRRMARRLDGRRQGAGQDPSLDP